MRRILIGTVVAAPLAALAQEDPFPIATNRPSFSDTSALVPFGHPQIETGFTRLKVGNNRFDTLGETMYRQRIGRTLELRISNLSYGIQQGGLSGWLDPSIGFSHRLQTSTARRPEISVLGYLSISNTSPLGTSAYQPTVKLAMYQPLDAKTGVGGNLNLSRPGDSPNDFTQAAGAVYVSRTFSTRWSSYFEVYGISPLSKGGSDGAFSNLGLLYLLNNRTQLDFRIGSGFNESRDGWFFGAGYSYRF